MFACVVFFFKKKKTLRQCLKSTAEKDLNAVKEWMRNQLNNKKALNKNGTSIMHGQQNVRKKVLHKNLGKKTFFMNI